MGPGVVSGAITPGRLGLFVKKVGAKIDSQQVKDVRQENSVVG